jgi:hypothetical protein
MIMPSRSKRVHPASNMVVILVIAGLVGACALFSLIAFLTRSGPLAQPPIPRTIVRLSGEGTKDTETFYLRGDYSASWVATATSRASGAGCHLEAVLHSTSKEVDLTKSLGEARLGAGKSKGTFIDLYGVVSTDYYLAVSSTCSWTFTFAPH